MGATTGDRPDGSQQNKSLTIFTLTKIQKKKGNRMYDLFGWGEGDGRCRRPWNGDGNGDVSPKT